MDNSRCSGCPSFGSLYSVDDCCSQGVRIEKKDLPSSLNDVIFIKKSELKLGKCIGSGSFGDVYKGCLYDQKVAVKVFKVQNSVSRVGQLVGSEDGAEATEDIQKTKKKIYDLVVALEREVRVLKSVSFCQIVQFYGVCLDPAAIVTEYCAYQSLFDFLRCARHDPEYAKRLTWKRRLLIAYDAAQGMNYLHTRQSLPALHRDLKSPNLLLDESMNCKICDFNTARFVDSNVVTNSIAANNPLWLAPEILQGKPFSRSSDVYPFGIILWELMTWMVPYESNGMPRNVHAVLFGTVFKNERPEIPANDDLIGDPCPVYDDYCELIEQCWCREPEHRPTFEEILNTLKEFLSSVDQMEGVSASENTIADVPKRSASIFSKPFSLRRRRTFHMNLRRSSRLGRNIEDKIRKENPEIEATWDDKNTEDEDLKDDQLPTPFAKGLPSFRSDDSFQVEAVTLQGGIRRPVPHPLSNRGLNVESCLSVSSSEIPEANSLESAQSTVQERWDRIRNVVRMISARRSKQRLGGAYQAPSLQGMEPNGPGENISADSTKCIVEQLSSMNEEERDTIDPSDEDIQSEGGWNLLKKQFGFNGRTPLYTYWAVLAKHMRARKELHSSGSSIVAAIEGGDILAAQVKAIANWTKLRTFLELNDLDGYPRAPKCWQDVLEVLFPRDTASMEPTQRAPKSETGDTKAIADSLARRMKQWFDKHHQIISKHRHFLESFLSSTEKADDGDKKWIESTNEGTRKNGESDVAPKEGISQEAWDFVRDCLIQTGLPSEWNSLIGFVRDRTAVPDEDWTIFRDLFFENDLIKRHDLWGFLEQLFV